MVTRLTNQLKSRLGELDWMDAETVRKASDKLDAMEVKIGHPSYMDDNNAMDNMYKEVRRIFPLKPKDVDKCCLDL